MGRSPRRSCRHSSRCSRRCCLKASVTCSEVGPLNVATSLRDPPQIAWPPLSRSFFERPSTELAPALLGQLLLREGPGGLTAGIIIEVEAYAGPEDRASHSRAGRTRRTEPMFGPAGHAYVYLVYGLHCCLNAVSDREGVAGAVLIRALEPYRGIDEIRRRRGRPHDADARLCAGPARLCQALAIDRTLDGHDLTLAGDLWIADPDPETKSRIAAAGVAVGPRIGVDYAGPDWATRPWRFGVQGHPGLSRRFAES